MVMPLSKNRFFSAIETGPGCLVYSDVLKYEHRTILINKNTPTVTSFIKVQWLMSVIILWKN